MDINENEEQMHEIEPQSSDPQPVPEPEPEQEQPEEETMVVEPESEPEEVIQESEEEEEAEVDANVDTDDPPAIESASMEILEDLPVMEPVAESEVEEAEAEPVAETEKEAEAEPVAETEEDMEPEVVTDSEEVLEVDTSEPLTQEELNKYAVVEKEILSEDEEEIIDPYASVDPVAEDGRGWYVIHCYSGNEDKVRHNIMQRIESMAMDTLIFDVVVPTEDEVNIKNGERQTVEKKVFPGYILVYMILTEESWYMVRNTPGVTGFVGMGNDPTALQPEEVARILKRMESESPRINVSFRTGERVRIVDGPFDDFYGKVAEIDMERATVRVMVNFFGRETPVELDFLQVEEA
jgi:transcriptional antiterminator NusG